MRRTVLTLCISLVAFSPAFAQQTPPTPPVPTTAPPSTPAPSAAPTPRPAVATAVPPGVGGGVVGGQRGAVAAQAQRPPAPVAAPTQAAVAVAPTPAPGSWQNIKVDVTISDSLSNDVQQRKLVSMFILDGRSGQVRSAAGDGLINVDARPLLRGDGRIFIQVTIEYRPELTAQQMQQAGLNRTALFSESLALLVADGRPIVASQSADPRSDRKVTVEITASVVK